MTLICAHRVNDPARLRELPTRFGVEIDVRSLGNELVLEHDAFTPGQRFEEWLEKFSHAFIVVNTKEEGLEQAISSLLDGRGIRNWAFLDQSFPFMIRTLRSGESRTMARLSEYENLETTLSLPSRPDWVWVDSFTGQWPSIDTIAKLTGLGQKMMIVSPELQGRSLEREKEEICARFVDAGATIHGVCTKEPTHWEQEGEAWWAG